MGVRPIPHPARGGAGPDLFSNLENVFSYGALGRIEREASLAAGREGFGLRVGSKLGAESVGLPGLVSLHASTVREALQVIVEGLRTRDTGGRVSLDVRDDTASFRFVVVAPNVEAADQIADGALAICFNLMKGLCGAGWRPEKVRLVRDAPRDPVPFNWFFEAPIEHSAACAALCSPQPRWMSVRVSTGPPTRKS